MKKIKTVQGVSIDPDKTMSIFLSVELFSKYNRHLLR